jgi:hypothetical protein
MPYNTVSVGGSEPLGADLVPSYGSMGETAKVLAVSVGGDKTLAVAAGASGTVVVKAGPGRLCRVLITTAGSAVMNFYDNPSAASGTIIGAIPATGQAVGQWFDFQ